jgi:hypothetical protein
MNDSSTHEIALELAALKAEVRGDIKNLATSVDEIKTGLNGVMALREDLAKFAIHHEQFRSETKTMWVRIDDQRGDIESLRDTVNHWKGALKMVGTIASILGVIAGAMVTWTWTQVQSVPVLVEKVRQLESSK